MKSPAAAVASRSRLVVLADGNSIHTQKWIEGLALTDKWDIYLISMNPSPTRTAIAAMPCVKDILQISPHTIREAGANYQYLFRLPSIRQAIRKIQPHVITTIYLTSYGLIGAITKGDAKLVHFVVGGDVMLAPVQSSILRFLSKWSLAQSDFVISSSQTMTNRMVSDLGVPEKRILTQQYGVGRWLLERDCTNKDYDFVSNRAWVANSNIDFMLKALQSFPKARTALIGDSVLGSESLAQNILALAQNMPSLVHLGTLAYQENIEMVGRARFLLSLTSSEGASLSVMEGMAMGCIPILSDIEPNREWVQEGHNGFLIPLGDLDTTIRIFRQALETEPIKLKLMSQINRDIIRERGVLETNLARVSDILCELL